MSGELSTTVRRVVIAVSLGVVALGAAACSGSDEEAPATTEAAATPTTPTTPVTLATSTVTSTTEPTTTTTDPIAAAEAAAVEAVLEHGENWRECVADIPGCDPAILERHTAGELLARLTTTLADWQSAGYESRPPTDPAINREEALNVELLEGGVTSAKVSVCQVDGTKLVDPNAGPDGSDVILNDRVSSTLAHVFAELDEDGVWRVQRSEVIDQVEGGDGCSDFESA
ncbi:MAG: hypothetical protein ACFCVK_23870 [Acidimicrobiales bacterium]